MRNWKILTGAIALGISGALLVAGCAENAPQGSSDTRAEQDKSPTPESADETEAPDAALATPVDAAAPTVIPGCDTMNAVAQQEYQDFGPEHFSEPAGEANFAVFDEQAGPIAQDVMRNARERSGCRWPVHMENTVTQYVAVLSRDDRERLVEALRAEAWPERQLDGASVFTSEVPIANSIAGSIQVNHVFVGDAWASIFYFGGQGDWGYAGSAIKGLLDANPELLAEAAESTPSPAE
ncbi:hypothetical protein ACFWHR_04595 [Leucobacter sp. NPDC058333]|uniref:hypothetical protein n=1 Tax=Leucobacter sp. NPDC058333 TaxID=3346450 RepID=UPI00366767EC